MTHERRYPTPLPLTISEADFQTAVIGYVRLLRYHVVHFRPVRIADKRWATPLQGDPGSPDLLLARDARVFLVELKRHGERPTPAQRGWLGAIGPEIGKLWTPVQWNDGTITDCLR